MRKWKVTDAAPLSQLGDEMEMEMASQAHCRPARCAKCLSVQSRCISARSRVRRSPTLPPSECTGLCTIVDMKAVITGETATFNTVQVTAWAVVLVVCVGRIPDMHRSLPYCRIVAGTRC